MAKDEESYRAQVSPRPTKNSPIEFPRPFQARVLQAIENALLRDIQRMTVVMPVGSGASIIMRELMYRLLGIDPARKILYVVGGTLLRRQALQQLATRNVTGNLPLGMIYRVAEIPDVASLNNILIHPQESPGGIYIVNLQTVDDLLRSDSREAGIACSQTTPFGVAISDGVGNIVPLVRLGGTEIFFRSQLEPRAALSADSEAIYTYSLEDAIADGALFVAAVEPHTDTLEASAIDFSSSEGVHAIRKLYIYYSGEDKGRAREISDEFARRGIATVIFALESDADLNDDPSRAGAMGDICISLCSPSSNINGDFVRLLERRGIKVIPVLVAPGPIPAVFADSVVVDATRDFTGVLSRIQVSSAINLTSIGVEQFENLVRAILLRRGLSVTSDQSSQVGFDVVGTTADNIPFVAQAKFYRHGAAGVREIRSFRRLAASLDPGTRCLLVTNGQLTSAARFALESINEEGPRIDVIDGLQIEHILAGYPDLVSQFFISGGRA